MVKMWRFYRGKNNVDNVQLLSDNLQTLTNRTMSMKGFKKQKRNPIELAKKLWPELTDDHLAHIEFDESLKPHKGQFDIVRQTGHDGTMIFTVKMLQDVLINPIKMQSHFKGETPDFERLRGIKYRVGYIYHSTAFGMVDLKIGRYPGQVERARMAVICEYVY